MIRIGKIAATHGLNGTLVLVHVLDKSDWLNKGQAIMVALRTGSQIPYFVTECRPTTDKEYSIKLEDITSAEEGKLLVGKAVYVDEKTLTSQVSKTPLLWIGFTLNEMGVGRIGVIEDVYQSTNQWLAKVDFDGKELLVPLIEPFIKQINSKNRWITVSLPEGFLDAFTTQK
jgi:16S rRNA processing protein RimM